MFQHERKQHPVGQGFFHSAFVQVAGSRFNYVYDCGSEHIDALTSEIQDYSEHLGDTSIDALFISHLDNDHVNGLDRLLASVSAKTVILPYLQPFERIMLIADAIRTSTISGSVLGVVTDPVRWFGDRGVRTVIFSVGNEEGEGPPVEPPPDRSPFESIDDILGEGTSLELDLKTARERGEAVQKMVSAIGESVEHISIPHTEPLGLRVGDYQINWSLIAFVHPENKHVKEFQKAVRKAFPRSGLTSKKWTKANSKWLLRVVHSPKDRAKLKSCYEMIRKNHNLTSMSLYSGPTQLGEQFGLYSCQLSSSYRRYIVPKCAWLGTGDSNMATQRRRDALMRHYEHVVDGVITVTAPHHGSRKNVDAGGEFIDGVGHLYVASAGAMSRHGHPHAEVVNMILSKGLGFVRVTEEPSSAFVERIVYQGRN